MPLQVARPVDNLERYNITRSNLNIYHNVVVGNRIHSPWLAQHPLNSTLEWTQLLLEPVTWLLDQHPSLGLVVGDHLTAKPLFLSLESINLSSLIRVTPIKTALQVDRILEEEHNHPFDLSDQSRPLWRLVIMPIEDDPSEFYMLYTFHHVIGDGRSAMMLTKQLVEQLNLQQEREQQQFSCNLWKTTILGRSTQILMGSNDNDDDNDDDKNNNNKNKKKSIPASIESRVNCYPSLQTLVYQGIQRLILPKCVKTTLGLETRYWAGEMDSSLKVPNKTELVFLQFSAQETFRIIQAAKRRLTTVQSILYVASVFAVKFVFMSDATTTSSSSTHHDGNYNNQGDTIVFATPVSLRDLIPNPIAPEDQGNYTSEILHCHIRVLNGSSFWTMAHSYRQQIVDVTRTSNGLRGLLEHFGMLSLLSKQDGAWEKFMRNQVKRDQHGRKATIKLSNLGRGWDPSSPSCSNRRKRKEEEEEEEARQGGSKEAQEEQAETMATIGFIVKDGIFSQSSGVTASALTMNVATANGIMTVITTWQKAAFHGRERGELFVNEFKRILLEALDEDKDDYFYREVRAH